MKPIVLIAFANEELQAPGRLRHLAEEQAQIALALSEAERRGLCEVRQLPNATLDRLIDAFQRFGERIAVFHYGGHANSGQLLLKAAGGQGNAPADAQALLPFLSGRPSLQLVFLNGCSTQAQAEALREAGINAIGTTNSVNDETARLVANTFYRGLAAGQTLERSWLDAQTHARAEKGPQRLYWEGMEPEPEVGTWISHFLHPNWKLIMENINWQMIMNSLYTGFMYFWNLGGKDTFKSALGKYLDKGAEVLAEAHAKPLAKKAEEELAKNKAADTALMVLKGKADRSEEEIVEAMKDLRGHLDSLLQNPAFREEVKQLLAAGSEAMPATNTFQQFGNNNQQVISTGSGHAFGGDQILGSKTIHHTGRTDKTE